MAGLGLTIPRDRLLTVAEVAKLLRRKPDMVYIMAKRGDLPRIVVGRRVLFSPGDLEAWLEAHKEL